MRVASRLGFESEGEGGRRTLTGHWIIGLEANVATGGKKNWARGFFFGGAAAILHSIYLFSSPSGCFFPLFALLWFALRFIYTSFPWLEKHVCIYGGGRLALEGGFFFFFVLRASVSGRVSSEFGVVLGLQACPVVTSVASCLPSLEKNYGIGMYLASSFFTSWLVVCV